MKSQGDGAPLIVILGPTASGKSSLAVNIATVCKGEIIAADSRTIYKEMNIGTAKPTLEERVNVVHWGFDLINPGERFTVVDFKKYALQKIFEIRQRGHTPIIVGGSGLYIDAVIFDYQFATASEDRQREYLNTLSVEELHNYCIQNNISLPNNALNKRHLIRQIELGKQTTSRRTTPIDNTIIVGIATKREVLRQRISIRTEQLFANGVVEEATLLGIKYGWQSEAMTGNIYRIISQYVDGHINLQQAKEKNIVADWHLAKRQLTWFKRNPYIKWLSLEDASVYLREYLAIKN